MQKCHNVVVLYPCCVGSPCGTVGTPNDGMFLVQAMLQSKDGKIAYSTSFTQYTIKHHSTHKCMHLCGAHIGIYLCTVHTYVQHIRTVHTQYWASYILKVTSYILHITCN